jgi:alpha-ketoglutarate-dependent taurine dioxygenase
MMKISTIHSTWGSIVELDKPLDFFNQEKNYWQNMIYSRKLLVFKRMNFSLIDYMKFADWFGTPWTADEYRYSRELAIVEKDSDGKEYATSQFSNKLISTRKIGLIEMPWHADIPNRSYRPFPHRSLWIVKNPNPEISGKTKWLNINLSDCKQYLDRELLDLLDRVTLEQQSWYAQGTDLQQHTFIKVHPVTGEQSLRLNYYNDLSRGITNAWIKKVYIDGVEQPDCSLIQRYIDCLTKHTDLLYYHQWDDYDIAIYDNYPFIHGRTPLVLGNTDNTQERKFYRTNIDHRV